MGMHIASTAHLGGLWHAVYGYRGLVSHEEHHTHSQCDLDLLLGSSAPRRQSTRYSDTQILLLFKVTSRLDGQIPMTLKRPVGRAVISTWQQTA